MLQVGAILDPSASVCVTVLQVGDILDTPVSGCVTVLRVGDIPEPCAVLYELVVKVIASTSSTA